MICAAKVYLVKFKIKLFTPNFTLYINPTITLAITKIKFNLLGMIEAILPKFELNRRNRHKQT